MNCYFLMAHLLSINNLISINIYFAFPNKIFQVLLIFFLWNILLLEHFFVIDFLKFYNKGELISFVNFLCSYKN